MKNLLNQKEEEIMQILWKLKQALIKEIINELPNPKPPYTTVASVVRKLSDRDIVGYKAYGNTYQYFPILKKKTYRKQVLKKVLKGYFGSSREELLSFFVKEEKMDVDEIKAWIDKIEKEDS